MSIVGPRPERPEIAAEYEKEMPEFRLRLQAKVTLKEMRWLCDGLSLTPQGAFEERHPKIIV